MPNTKKCPTMLTREQLTQLKRNRRLSRLGKQPLHSLLATPHSCIQEGRIPGDVKDPLLLSAVLDTLPAQCRADILPMMAVAPQHRYCFLRRNRSTRHHIGSVASSSTNNKDVGASSSIRDDQEGTDAGGESDDDDGCPFRDVVGLVIPHNVETYRLSTHQVVPRLTLWYRCQINHAKKWKDMEWWTYAVRRARMYGVDLVIDLVWSERLLPSSSSSSSSSENGGQSSSTTATTTVLHEVVRMRLNYEKERFDDTLQLEIRCKVTASEDISPHTAPALLVKKDKEKAMLQRAMALVQGFTRKPKHLIRHLRISAKADVVEFPYEMMCSASSESLSFHLDSFSCEASSCQNVARIRRHCGAYHFIRRLDLSGLRGLVVLEDNAFSYLRWIKHITLSANESDNETGDAAGDGDDDDANLLSSMKTKDGCSKLSRIHTMALSLGKRLESVDLSACVALQVIDTTVLYACPLLRSVRLPAAGFQHLTTIGSYFMALCGDEYGGGINVLDFGDCPSLTSIGKCFLMQSSVRVVKFGCLPLLESLSQSFCLYSATLAVVDLSGATSLVDIAPTAFDGCKELAEAVLSSGVRGDVAVPEHITEVVRFA